MDWQGIRRTKSHHQASFVEFEVPKEVQDYYASITTPLPFYAQEDQGLSI
jgi:hypothetical protein